MFNHNQLINEARTYAQENYLSKSKLGHDEELQLLSCAYSVLYLTARTNKTVQDLATAHEFIAQCFEKIGDSNYAARHLQIARAYK